MKYIKFAGEVFKMPENASFWIESKPSDYPNVCQVNLSRLDDKGRKNKEKRTDKLIFSEAFKSKQEAEDRLNELLTMLRT